VRWAASDASDAIDAGDAIDAIDATGRLTGGGLAAMIAR
jgi:hypothetical protein